MTKQKGSAELRAAIEDRAKAAARLGVSKVISFVCGKPLLEIQKTHLTGDKTECSERITVNY